MFELEILTKKAGDNVITVKELGYVEEAEFSSYWAQLVSLTIDIEEIKDKLDNPEENDQELSKKVHELAVQAREITVEAFSIPEIKVNGEVCDPDLFIKKAGNSIVYEIGRELQSLGRLSEESEKK